MANKLTGRAVNDVLSEFVGPRTGWNYAGSDPAYCDIRVIGTGAVKVQINSTAILGSTSPDPNPIDVTYIPSPGGWSDVGGAVAMSDGLVAKTLTAGVPRNWVRVIVSTAGDGVVHLGGRWAKR